MNSFDVAIIGAGITGLSAAYALAGHFGLKIALLEQFSVPHPFGGSHGAARMSRSIYPEPGYRALIQRAARCDWPEWEREMGELFFYPKSCCTFGRGPLFQHYLNNLKDSEIDILNLPAARRLFPQFRFPNIEAVLHDKTGGVLAAEKLIYHLKATILNRGVMLQEQTKVLSLTLSEDPIRIATDQGELFARSLILAAGAWMSKLLAAPIVPIRQTVGYFKLRGNQENSFPNWSFIGEDGHLFYGLPAFQSEGIKIARHDTVGLGDDPDRQSPAGDPAALALLEAFIGEHFVQPIDRLEKSESCFYANAPDEGFILDLLPNNPRVVIGSVCSGHGFKFAPLTGKILAQLALDGKTDIEEFERFKSLFSFPG